MHAYEDRLFSLFAIVLVIGLGWRSVTIMEPTSRVEPRLIQLPLAPRVVRVADAIAASEGYFAPGRHDGHSLPYRLNNPGLLKATAIGGDTLDTWTDTGLLIFPTADHGWQALRFQVCAMLTGASRVYEPSDTLVEVGLKYADGDPDWGIRVAARLGLESADATLADLAVGLPRSGRSRCRTLARWAPGD